MPKKKLTKIKVNYEPKDPVKLWFRWSIRHPVSLKGFKTKKQAISFAKSRSLKAEIRENKKGRFEVIP